MSQASPRRLVFVHLSDLHFRQGGTPLAEREAALRDRLLDDIPKTVALAEGTIEAILLTGDLARGGQKAEYEEARAWLDSLCDRLGLDVTKTLSVPGNHDVDWEHLKVDPGRVAINNDLRLCAPHLLDAKIDGLLSHPDVVLAPIANYQEFAAGSACDIEKCLAWDVPPIPLGGGYELAIRGANSVINSDGDDGLGTMAVHLNQLLVSRTAGLVRMLMLHHGPQFWARPDPTPGACGHHVVLYGHTHQAEHRMEGDSCLEVTAGAVHPEEREDFAIPGYNVIEISVEEPDEVSAYAHVRIFHRDFSRDAQRFSGSEQGPSIDERVKIIRTTGTSASTATPPTVESVDLEEVTRLTGGAETQPPLESADGSPDPSRVVRHGFESLGAGDRMRLLDRIGLDRAEVAGLPPHRQIRLVAELVIARSLLTEFHSALEEISG